MTHTATILIAEDQDEIRAALRVTLKRAGFEVIEATDGTSALAHFHESRIDLVVTDMVMPKKGGLELITDLLRHHPDLGIVAISGVEKELKEAERYGANRVLAKPFTPDELVSLVCETLVNG